MVFARIDGLIGVLQFAKKPQRLSREAILEVL